MTSSIKKYQQKYFTLLVYGRITNIFVFFHCHKSNQIQYAIKHWKNKTASNDWFGMRVFINSMLFGLQFYKKIKIRIRMAVLKDIYFIS